MKGNDFQTQHRLDPNEIHRWAKTPTDPRTMVVMFKDGHLQTGNVQRDRIKHAKPFSVELLNQYASELDKIADEFDLLEYSLQKD